MLDPTASWGPDQLGAAFAVINQSLANPVAASAQKPTQGQAVAGAVEKASAAAADPAYLRPEFGSGAPESEIASGTTRTKHLPLPADMQAQFDKAFWASTDGSELGALAASLLGQAYAGKQFDGLSWEKYHQIALDRLAQGVVVSTAVVGTEEVPLTASQQIKGGFLNTDAGAFTLHAINAGGMGLVELYDSRAFEITRREHGTASFSGEVFGTIAGIASGGGIARGASEGAEAAARVTIAPRTAFVGPLIGNSGFRTSTEFAEAVGMRYQGFVDDAFAAAQRLEARGLLRGNANTRIGDYVDRISARDLRAYLTSEGISEGPGRLVQMNRWLRDPSGSGLYVRPDVRIPSAGRIFDATVGFKPSNSTQIVRFGQYSGGDRITLVRPSSLGSYSIVP